MNIRMLSNMGVVKNATWADIEKVLPELKIESAFKLSIEPEPEIGPETLYIESENGYYRPIMVNADGGGYRFSDPSASGKEDIEILGDYYDPMGVTQDYDLIVRMIKEFYHTGNVPEELWTPQPGAKS